VEKFYEVRQRFLRALLNLGKVSVGSSLFSAGDKLANKPIRQILEVGNGSWGQAVKP